MSYHMKKGMKRRERCHINKVILIGRLTRDPDVRYTQDGKAFARYTLAVNRMNREDPADFISCVTFGKNAEFVEKYLHQGSKIAVIGRIQTGSYTNREGQKVYTTDVVVEQHEFAESKSQGSGRQQDPLPTPDDNGFMYIPDDADDEGLPFN